MPLLSVREILDDAAENDYGVVALNANNMEQVQAIFEAADETDSPVITQFSRGARKYARGALLKRLLQGAIEEYPQVPVAIHLDHGNSVGTCMDAVRSGFTSVMMDGSLSEDGKTPSNFDYNVDVTSKVIMEAAKQGISVEGELGCLGSLTTGRGEKEDGQGHEGALDESQLLTSVDEAVRFIEAIRERTGQDLDALAVAIGTSHGAYKFTEPPTGDVLRMDRIEEIHRALPNTHLVMHGSSSVPQELKKIINDHGGNLRESWGVPIEQIQRGIRAGVRKVNVDTDNRLAMTGAVRGLFEEHPELFDMRDWMNPAREAMKAVCMERMEAFGQAGKASGVRRRPSVKGRHSVFFGRLSEADVPGFEA